LKSYINSVVSLWEEKAEYDIIKKKVPGEVKSGSERAKIMKTMQKTTVLLLLAAMLLSSCVQNGDDGKTTDTEPSAAETPSVTETAEEPELRDNVPELDYDGDTLTFSTNEQYYYEMDVEESVGEITNDVVFERNLMMEERFNVVIDKIITDTADHYAQANFIRQTVMSGDQSFDVAANYVYTAGTVVIENMLLDWNEIPYVELHQPWWVSNINNAFTLDGKLFAAVSDMCVSSMQLAYAYLYNKELAQNYDVEDLYTVVDEGRWTLDYIYDLTKQLYSDANGNGQVDDGDVFGLVTDATTSLDCYFATSGQPLLQETENGLEVMVDSERAVDVYEKVNRLIWENPGAMAKPSYEEYGVKVQMFMNNQGLLVPIRLIELFHGMRDMEFDYGILPFPKFDETQTNYYTYCLDNYSVLMVPNNVERPDMVGALIEAMSCESKKSVMPAFYETALQDKFTRDERSVEMLDLIMDGRSYDVSILYSASFSASRLAWLLRDTVRDHLPYVSTYEANMPTYKKLADKLYETVQSLGE